MNTFLWLSQSLSSPLINVYASFQISVVRINEMMHIEHNAHVAITGSKADHTQNTLV